MSVGLKPYHGRSTHHARTHIGARAACIGACTGTCTGAHMGTRIGAHTVAGIGARTGRRTGARISACMPVEGYFVGFQQFKFGVGVILMIGL